MNTAQRKNRHRLVCAVLLIALFALLGRAVQLMLVERKFLLKQGQARAVRNVLLPAYRGMLTDRKGAPLAISTPVQSICLNPTEVNLTDPHLSKLAHLLQVSPKYLLKKIKDNKDREFLYLKRAVSPIIAGKVKSLDIEGVFLQQEYRRYYPEGEVASQVVGFTNIDDQGQEGMELRLNHWLQGVSGRKRVVKDRLGRVVQELGVLKTPKRGRNIALSLDLSIQYLAYRALEKAVKQFQAKSGSIVVLDVNTGEVLAMVNAPTFNPNQRRQASSESFRNRAVTDVFEPASTIKAFSIANALASGRYTPNDMVDTNPGWFRVGGKVVRDIRNHGKMDVTTVLQKSSNVGVSKLTLSLPQQSLPNLLQRVGFGESTGSGFPGESQGKLPSHLKWKPFGLATLSFGYGLSTTALQLAQAYSVIAAEGVRHPISFLRIEDPSKSEKRILSPVVARQVLTMLESVVDHGGTATRARINDYRVAGKTGTVRMIGPSGYLPDHHIGLFVGTAPASHPRLVTVVVISDPQGKQYYGGLVAAPAFAEVMEGALHYLQVHPDHWLKKGAA